jgi:hypothetical protein
MCCSHAHLNNAVEHPSPEKQNTDTGPQHQKTIWNTFTNIRKEIRKSAIFQGHPIKNSKKNAEHNTKYSETTHPTDNFMEAHTMNKHSGRPPSMLQPLQQNKLF